MTEAQAAASDVVLQAAKATVRKSARAHRATLFSPDAPKRLAEALLARHAPPAGAVIAGYWPMGDEMDPRPLMLALAQRGHTLALPITPPRAFLSRLGTGRGAPPRPHGYIRTSRGRFGEPRLAAGATLGL